MPDSDVASTTIGQKIIIVGSPGAGKTWLATQLALALNRPHVELDALYWGLKWKETPTDIFRTHVKHALQGDTWVVDGNYSKVRDIVWGQADVLIWLDYSLVVIMKRLVYRTLKRIVNHEELWNGNYETFHKTFFSRESLLWWAITTYHRRRENYSSLLASAECRHLTVIPLQSPQATNTWLKSVIAYNSERCDFSQA